ncbi:tetraacyldisaccharide 4'-kinase [Calditrichota bacterium GD2]
MRFLRMLARLLLLPFSLLYGLAMEIRNILFDLKILPVYASRLPVISVGNLVAGGTGKTPFTIWLAAQLAKRYRVAIVSRGYGRESKGLQIVAQNGSILLSAEQAGDEPLLMAKKVPAATVLVSEKRRSAVQWIEQRQAAEVIVLDDGFQHRYVQRDVDIVLFKKSQQFWRNFMLPSGTWREFPHRVSRAHYVGLAAQGKLPFIPLHKQFHVQTMSGPLVDLHLQACLAPEDLKDVPVAAFAGIADPQSFFETLAKMNMAVKRTFAFGDHHRFTENDLLRMGNICRQEKLKYLICTEKDLMKISEIIDQNGEKNLQGIKIVALAYALAVQEEFLIKAIEKTIDKKLKSYYIS